MYISSMFSIQRTNTDFPLLDLSDRSIPKTAFLIENAPNMQINCKNAYGSADATICIGFVQKTTFIIIW